MLQGLDLHEQGVADFFLVSIVASPDLALRLIKL